MPTGTAEGRGELVIIAGHDPTIHAGGTESYVIGQALAAQLAGYQPHVFVLGRRTETVAVDFGILHRAFSPLPRTVAYTAAAHTPFILDAVVRLLAGRAGPHVIQAHSGWSAIADLACVKLARENVPASSVASFYATVWHEQHAKWEGQVVRDSARLRLRYALLLGAIRIVSVPFEQRGYRRCDRVVVNYERVRELLATAYGPRPDVIRLSYAAPAAFDELRPDSGSATARPETGRGEPPLIVAVSRHSARKGIDVLIRALAELHRRGVSFSARLIGGGRLLEEHRALVRELDLTGLVSVPGRVRDIRPHLAECDVFVLPSIAEDSGSLSVLEALQFSKPIIASAVDGIPEDLTDEQDALLVPPGDASSLSDALARMLADQPLRRRLSSCARALYERRFAPHAAADNQGRLYASLGLLPR
jgi:glycosyltransferase involved in cell wall biosynthesis